MWPGPSTKTLCPEVIKFSIWVVPSLVIITIHLVCLINAWRREEDFKRNHVFSIHNLYGQAPAQKPFPGGGGMKFTIFVDPSLVVITMYLNCLNHAPE